MRLRRHCFASAPLALYVAVVHGRCVCASTLTDAACAALLDAAQISHPLDMSYDSLHADIVPVSSSDDDFRMVSRYLVNTHGPTHNGFTMSLHQLFKVRRRVEDERFIKLHNRRLLWHGSRTTNFAGILSQVRGRCAVRCSVVVSHGGVCAARTDATAVAASVCRVCASRRRKHLRRATCSGARATLPTSYVVHVRGAVAGGTCPTDVLAVCRGRQSSKSANYCHIFRGVGDGVGLLLLCDVSLGEMYERTQAEYMDAPPKGKHSTMGVGKYAPV